MRAWHASRSSFGETVRAWSSDAASRTPRSAGFAWRAAIGFGGGQQARPQVFQGPVQQSGHVHLGDSDLGGDAGLAHLVGEPQGEDPPVPDRQRRDQHPERPVGQPLVDLGEAGVQLADEVAELEVLGVRSGGVGLVERAQLIRLRRTRRRAHLLDAGVQVAGELPGRRVVADQLGQPRLRGGASA